MDAILNVDKPSGISSFKVVEIIRKMTKIKKVGHAGTLDPMATGVLLICLGNACKRSSSLMGFDKEYEAEITFGIETDSGDSDGRVISECEADIDENDLREAIGSFVGEIDQIPPMVSALHHKGVRLYELARQGKTVAREPRKITINGIKLLSFKDGKNPKAEILVSCSKGTYIRTLCEDIGKKLGCRAHESRLKRTRVGKFDISSSVTIEDVRKAVDSNSLKEMAINEY